MQKASKIESEELLSYIKVWMNNHSAFDAKSTLIQIAITEFVLNKQHKTLFLET